MHGNLSRSRLGNARGNPAPDQTPNRSPHRNADLSPDRTPDHTAAATANRAPAPHPPGLRVLELADRDATLARATGSADARVHGWLVNDLSFALNTPPALAGPAHDPQAAEDRVCAAVSAMCDIAPRDTLEGMLAAQMVAVHSAALDSLRRAAETSAADRARDADLRHAARLLNVFQRQMRVRDDRRNPVLARSLTGRHAPDAPGRPAVPTAQPARETGALENPS